MKVSHRIAGFTLAGALGFMCPGVAQASVENQASTPGCFYTATNSCGLNTTGGVNGLTFARGFFDGWTSTGDFLALGATPGYSKDLGLLLLHGTSGSSSSTSFLLQLIFTPPATTSPTSIFTASLLGDIESLLGGGANPHSGNPGQTFAFKGPDWDGNFPPKFGDGNPEIPNTNSGPESAFTKTTVTPEPGTTALFATGLMGLLPMVRLRRKKTKTSVV